MSFRKRLQKTSAEQYEEYLKMMEEDELFRSSTNDPTIDPKYIESCWQKLMLRLNSCSSGPTLTIGEWKKRFNDWKNSVRSKNRKAVEETERTGTSSIRLSFLEKRGLSVWERDNINSSSKIFNTEDLTEESVVCETPVEVSIHENDQLEFLKDKSLKRVRSIRDFLSTESSSEIEKKKLELEERRIALEEKRLKFEIEKYKFEHPGFVFD